MEMSNEDHLPLQNLHFTYLKGGLDRREFSDLTTSLYLFLKKKIPRVISIASSFANWFREKINHWLKNTKPSQIYMYTHTNLKKKDRNQHACTLYTNTST